MRAYHKGARAIGETAQGCLEQVHGIIQIVVGESSKFCQVEPYHNPSLLEPLVLPQADEKLTGLNCQQQSTLSCSFVIKLKPKKSVGLTF